MSLPITFEALIEQAHQHKLYEKLIKQLNKDLVFANVDLEFNESVLPTSLKVLLHETIYTLIQEKFDKYLSLLYIIDVPEQQIKKLDGSDIVNLSEQVVFLILKREWQKVWLKSQY